MGMNEGIYAGLLEGFRTISSDYDKQRQGKIKSRNKAADKYAQMLADNNLELVNPNNTFKDGMTVVDVVKLFKQRPPKEKTYLDTTIASPEFIRNSALMYPKVAQLVAMSDPSTITVGTIKSLIADEREEIARENMDKREAKKFEREQQIKAQGELYTAATKDPNVLNDPELKDYFKSIASRAGFEIVTLPSGIAQKLYDIGLGNAVDAARGIFGQDLGTQINIQPKTPTQTPQPTPKKNTTLNYDKVKYEDLKKLWLADDRSGGVITEAQDEALKKKAAIPSSVPAMGGTQLAPPSIMETQSGTSGTSGTSGVKQNLINDLASGGGSAPMAPSVNPNEAMKGLSTLAQNYINSLKTKLPSIMELRNKKQLTTAQ